MSKIALPRSRVKVGICLCLVVGFVAVGATAISGNTQIDGTLFVELGDSTTGVRFVPDFQETDADKIDFREGDDRLLLQGGDARMHFSTENPWNGNADSDFINYADGTNGVLTFRADKLDVESNSNDLLLQADPTAFGPEIELTDEGSVVFRLGV